MYNLDMVKILNLFQDSIHNFILADYLSLTFSPTPSLQGKIMLILFRNEMSSGVS